MLEIYVMRQKGDAWLLSNKIRRKWFPHKVFTQIYPDWEEKKNHLFEGENRVEFGLEYQLYLHRTVDIND